MLLTLQRNFGRMRQAGVVIDARRNLLKAMKDWYPSILVLFGFMVAIAREPVNHGDSDGSVVDPLIWNRESKPKARRNDSRLTEDLAGLLGPPGLLDFLFDHG